MGVGDWRSDDSKTLYQHAMAIRSSPILTASGLPGSVGDQAQKASTIGQYGQRDRRPVHTHNRRKGDLYRSACTATSMWISSRLDNLLHGARQPTALGARKSGHADAPIRGDVDVVLGARSVRIRGGGGVRRFM